MVRVGNLAKSLAPGAGQWWAEAAIPLLVTLAAITLRCSLVSGHDVISTDGTGYIDAARQIAAGNLHGFAVSGFYPVLIWLVSLSGCDLETAGRAISVFFGGALPCALYYLGATLFSRRTALAASFLAAVWPTLVSWSCEVMTQATYIFLVTSGALLLLQMVRRPTMARGTAAGVVLALAYLTRPEGFLLFFVLPLAPVLLRRADFHLLKRALLGYGLSFLLLFLVNLFLIRETTGIWQLSAKTGSALNDSLVINGRVGSLLDLPPGKAYGYLDILRQYPDFVWTTACKNLKQLWSTLVPAPMWGLALLGIAASRGKNDRLLLLALCAPLCVLIAFFYVGPEYTQPYLPSLFLLACEGGTFLEQKILQLTAVRLVGLWSQIPLTAVLALLFAGWLLVQQLSIAPPVPYRPSSDDGRRDSKNIGLLLKRDLPPGKFMTPSARIAFYADRERINVPNTTALGMIKIAKENRVRFIVFPGKIDWDASGSWDRLFLSLLTPLKPGSQPADILICNPGAPVMAQAGLRPYLLYRNRSSFGVAVYEVLP